MVVAYSGGVDSSFLLKTAVLLNPETSIGVIAQSPSLSKKEFDFAIDLAKKHALPIEIITTTELEDKNYTNNDLNRCFYCKSDLFSHLLKFAAKNQYEYIADGTNFDDIKGHRPGHKAAQEKNILSPLLECELTKTEIRELSKMLNLETHDKPAMACLASRVTSGTEITESILKIIESAEDVLYKLGFRRFRVRYHENGSLARIEFNMNEIEKALSPQMRQNIHDKLVNTGFQYVTIDILGYQTQPKKYS